jgi:hypothetical protein
VAVGEHWAFAKLGFRLDLISERTQKASVQVSTVKKKFSWPQGTKSGKESIKKLQENHTKRPSKLIKNVNLKFGGPPSPECRTPNEL